MKRPLALAALLSCLAPAAQSQSSEGLLVGMPTGAFVGPGTTSDGSALNPNDLHRKRAGFRKLTTSSTPDTVGQPIFTASEMFNGGLGTPAFRVDAFSAGQDVVNATPPVGGVSMVSVQPHSWAVMAYSVSPTSVGEAGSLIAQELASTGGAAADVFTYTLPGSEIPTDISSCYPVDAPQRALDASEMLLGGAGSPDITSLDYYMTLYESGSPIVGDLVPEPVVFFSVDYDSVFPPGGGPPLVPAAWFDCGLPSPATILKTRWIKNPGDPIKGGAWTQPRVHLSYDHLGLDPDDDVDALSVSRDNFMLIFSIKRKAGDSLDEQLQVASWPSGVTLCSGMSGLVQTGILYASTPTDVTVPLATRLGLGALDEIDSVCDPDPGGQVFMDLALGTPVGKFTAVRGMSAQVYRDDDDPGGGATLTFAVAGIPSAALPSPTMVHGIVIAPVLGMVVFFTAPAGFNGSDHHQVSFTVPSLASTVGLQVSTFWLQREIRGSLVKECSPTVVIGL